MPRSFLLIFSILCVQLSSAQEIFVKGEHYGLNYNGSEYYAAVFDEIKIHGYFVEGRMGTVWFNLSKNKDNSEKTYRKFNFKFLDRLLVIGYTTNGKVDILDETGEIFYLEEGPYDRVLNQNHLPNYGNDDMLTVRKNGKVGLYNWVKKTEILPADYTKIVVHESCQFGEHFIYARKLFKHTIWNEKGEEQLSFKAPMVSDIYPDDICHGFIIQWQHKIGYCCQKRDGSFFLLKPKYDDIYFPVDDASIIIVENRDRFGLFVNNSRMLKCKYDNITYVDDPYVLATAEKDGITWKVKNNGELVLFSDNHVQIDR